MSQREKFSIIVISCLVLLLIIFVATKYIKERRLNNDEKFYGKETAEENKTEEEYNQSKQDMQMEDEEKPGEFLKEEDWTEDDEEEFSQEKDGSEVKESFLDIKKADCEDKCKKYGNDQENLKYCQEICGLKSISEKDSIGECEDLEDLEEDYCLRDVAIKKLDYSICDKIEDAGIQKMCRNRITEIIIDNKEDL